MIDLVKLYLLCSIILILEVFFVQMKVAFGGLEPVSQPPRQPDRSNEQPGPSNALALAGVFHIIEQILKPE